MKHASGTSPDWNVIMFYDHICNNNRNPPWQWAYCLNMLESGEMTNRQPGAD